MRIRLMTDLHYSALAELPVKDDFYRAYLARFFEEGSEADWYLCLGDLTQYGLEEEYRSVYAIIDSLGKRSSFLHVPGNHDLLTAGPETTETWGATPPIANGFGVIDTEAAVLVFLNTCKTKSALDWGGQLDDLQLELLRNQLAQAGGRPVLVFGHHPLPDTTALSEQDMMRVENAEPLLSVIQGAAGPCFWFNGHNHIQTITSAGNWTYVQTASAICLPCWRELEILPGSIRITSHVVNDPKLYDLARQSLDGFAGFHDVPPAVALGGELDQDALWEPESDGQTA
ncbi:metallophosphoesterase [Paenibacillus sp. CC-CFT747]|nr:metallophosphoesterase [Paenibacillus sp. CC-CFT747]